MPDTTTIKELLTWTKKQKANNLKDAYAQKSLIHLLESICDINDQKNGNFVFAYMSNENYKIYTDAVEGKE